MNKIAVHKALRELSYHLGGYEAFRVYAETEDCRKAAGIYYRYALRLKTEGLVEHDRILANEYHSNP